MKVVFVGEVADVVKEVKSFLASVEGVKEAKQEVAQVKKEGVKKYIMRRDGWKENELQLVRDFVEKNDVCPWGSVPKLAKKIGRSKMAVQSRIDKMRKDMAAKVRKDIAKDVGDVLDNRKKFMLRVKPKKVSEARFAVVNEVEGTKFPIVLKKFSSFSVESLQDAFNSFVTRPPSYCDKSTCFSLFGVEQDEWDSFSSSVMVHSTQLCECLGVQNLFKMDASKWGIVLKYV